MFYLLHGVGKSYRINLDLVACIAWQTSDKSGAVSAEIVFTGGARMEFTAEDHLWKEFLAEVDRKPRGEGE